MRMAESKGQPFSIRIKKVIKEINDHILGAGLIGLAGARRKLTN